MDNLPDPISRKDAVSAVVFGIAVAAIAIMVAWGALYGGR